MFKRKKKEANKKSKNANIVFKIDDPIHPLQFWGNVKERRSDPLFAEKKMWAAVLMDAYDCARGRVSAESSKTVRQVEVEKAKEWFFSKRKTVGSFLWVSSLLQLPSDQILKEVEGILGNEKMAA